MLIFYIKSKIAIKVVTRVTNMNPNQWQLYGA